MDSRAKQRLTGAVILVALFVLLVPELLTGPRDAVAPEGAPSDEGMRSYTIDLDAAAPAAAPKLSSEPAVALPQVADTRAKPGEDAAPAAPAPAPETESVDTSAPAPTATAPRAEAPKPVPVQPAQAPPSRPASVPAERGTFVVQLGSFGSKENADRLVRDMTAKGFTAFVAPITSGGRELYRVRVGPTRERAQAEALAAQLRRIGQSGSIVPIS
jgi:DedD protein